MQTYRANFCCPKCGNVWETDYDRKPKQGFFDYCQCKQCLLVRKEEGGELRPLHQATSSRKL
jgi:hypothetical protein